MGIVVRQSAKNLVVVVSGAVLGASLLWISTKFNSKQQYGSIGTLTIYAVLASQILLFGLSNTLAVYAHRFANDPKKKKLLLTFCLTLPALITTLCIIPYYLLRGWIFKQFQPEDVPFIQHYFMWLPLYTILWIYMIVLEQYLGSQLKVAVSVFMREVVVRIANITLVLLFGFNYIDFNTLVIGTIVIYFIPVTLFFWLATRTKDFGLSFNFSDFSRADYKEVLHFSWYHFLMNLSILLMGYLDQALLPIYDKSGFSSVAIYRVAIFFISFLMMPSKALIPASFAVMARAFTDGDHEKAKDIYVRATINILITTVGVAVLLCCNLQNAVAVIKNGYSDIIPVFLILFIGTLINIITGMNDQVLSITNYYKFNFYLALGITAILYLMLRFLIPVYGVYGAAWGSAIALTVFSIFKSLFVWKKLNMVPYTNKTILVFIAAVPALAAGYFFPYFFEPSRHVYVHSFFDAIMRSTVIVIVYGGMLLWLKPSGDLEEYIGSVRKNKRLF